MPSKHYSNLIEHRHKLQKFYAAYSKYVNMALRFIVSLITMLCINRYIGFHPIISMIPITALIAVLCAFVPWSVDAIILGIMVAVNLYSLSLLMMLIFSIFMIIIICCYYIFEPGDSMLLYLVPLLFFIKIPCAVPVLVGLALTGFSVVPMCFGILAAYFIQWVSMNSTMISSGVLTRSQQMQSLAEGLISNPQMIGYMITFVITVLVVNIVRKLAVRFSWEAAVISGSLVCLVLNAVLSAAFDYSTHFAQSVAGVLIGAFAGIVLGFFIFSVDYRSTIESRFEDNDYYYYVKAVPKIDIQPEDRHVHKFVTQKKKEQNVTTAGEMPASVSDLLKNEDEV